MTNDGIVELLPDEMYAVPAWVMYGPVNESPYEVKFTKKKKEQPIPATLECTEMYKLIDN